MTDTIHDRRRFLTVLGAGTAGIALFGCGRSQARTTEHYPVTMTPAQWKQKLGPAAFDILREDGTERPFTSPLLNVHDAGVFKCKGCAQPLFSSKTKYDSHTGWPSFWAPLPHAIRTRVDGSFGMTRTEVHCDRCGGHLGHVFDDGPQPTGKRYCMNGLAMTFAAT